MIQSLNISLLTAEETIKYLQTLAKLSMTKEDNPRITCNTMTVHLNAWDFKTMLDYQAVKQQLDLYRFIQGNGQYAYTMAQAIKNEKEYNK